MSGTLYRVLLMASTAHLLCAVPGLGVLDPEDNELRRDIHHSNVTSTFSPLLFNREQFPFAGGESDLQREKNLDSNEGENAMAQARNLEHIDDKDHTLVSHNLNDSDEEGKQFDGSQHGDMAVSGLSSNLKDSTVETDLPYNEDRLQMVEDDTDMSDRSGEAPNTNLYNLETGESNFKSHGDAFPCPPCSCSHTAGRFVIANCSHAQINSVPYYLPKNTVVLNLSFNKFRQLNMSSFLTYPSLVNLSLESNRQLTNIFRGYETNTTSNVLQLNLFDCAIDNIENASFSVMPRLTNLTLKKNRLVNLTGSMFEGLEKLKCLDLSANQIKKIEAGTFDNFSKLKALDLGGNKNFGYFNKTLSPLLFKNLKHLQKLSLHMLSQGWEKSYPNQVLEQLVNLQELKIDGLPNPAEFKPGVKSLQFLTHLHIGGGFHNCRITNITETFFDNIPYLRSFVLEFCPQFLRIHPNAYTRLPDLVSLTIKLMKYYDIDSAFRDLTALNNSKLTSITFSGLREPLYKCKFLGIDQAKYITNIGIEELDLSMNQIALVGNDFFDNLPTTVKKLTLKRNKLTSQSLNNLAAMPELRELDLSLQNVNDDFNDDDNSEDDMQLSEFSTKPLTDSNNDFIPSQEIQDQDTQLDRCNKQDEDLHWESMSTADDITIDLEIKRKSQDTNRVLHLPPKLQILKAFRYTTFGMQILQMPLSKKNSLSEIDFSNSFMSRWGSGMLPPKITQANLANNYCRTISRKFFQRNNSHSHLILNNNFLGSDFAADDNGAIFANLNNTVHLDISTNLIYKLPRYFFKGLSNLKYLKVSDNRLAYLNTSFLHMKQLQFIDLGRNAIRWISEETRNDLDAIATFSGHKIELDLTENPLPCTCAGLDLITWMATTKVHFRNKNSLKCDRDSVVSKHVVNMEKRREILQRLCMSKTALIVGCVAALSVGILSVGLGLMYRYRWKLRYLHNVAVATIFGFKPDILPKSGCTFDAYLIYTKETQDFVIHTCIKELEIKRGHRICVEDRDFLAGTYTVSNIISAVRNSTKTVPVLTPTFYNGVFSEYSFKMAVMEELYKHRSVLYLLLYKPIPTEQMSHDELKVMKRNSYIEFPPEEEADDNIMQKFWDDLSLAIGHTEIQTPRRLPNIQ